jgi:hypothetical protein
MPPEFQLPASTRRLPETMFAAPEEIIFWTKENALHKLSQFRGAGPAHEVAQNTARNRKNLGDLRLGDRRLRCGNDGT